MKIASYNINRINGQLPNLLRWLAGETPDVVCLQNLRHPATCSRSTSYWTSDTMRYGMAKKLEWGGDPVALW
jgi:exonuclease III